MAQQTGQQEVKTGSETVIKGIQHVSITVSDIGRSERWYSRALGLTRQFVEKHHESDAGGYAVVLGNETGAFNIGLEHHPENTGDTFNPRRNGLDHFCLSVGDRKDIERWAERLDSENIAHSGIVDILGMPMAVLNFKDPDMIAIELISIG